MRYRGQLKAIPHPWPVLQVGSTGWWVRMLCRLLAEFDIGPPEWKNPTVHVEEIFGHPLKLLVEKFQRAHNLTVDGVVGPLTWSVFSQKAPVLDKPRKYDPKTILALALGYNALLVALGVKEDPFRKNKGEVVDAFNKHTLGHVGEPWCATSQDFIIDTAFKVLGFGKPPFDVGASASSIHKRAEAAGRLVPLEQAEAGYLFLVPGGPTGWKHVGMLKEKLPNGKIATFEGNSNDEGSAEGYELCSRQRNSSGLVFVNWT